ncbi:MAG: CidA/LrgA family protein [Lachnospiraceae bacterium]
MKFVKEAAIIFGVTMAGEFLYTLLPFPVPAGVYGLFLLLFLLLGGVVKLNQVETTGMFLLDTMAMMFIPATVGIIESKDALLEVILPYTVIIAVTTVFVMAVTGTTAQFLIGKMTKKGEEANE